MTCSKDVPKSRFPDLISSCRLVASRTREAAINVSGTITNARMISTVERAARFCCCEINPHSRRWSGAKTIANTAAQSTAPKNGQRIHLIR